jgi:hypothetical protein
MTGEEKGEKAVTQSRPPLDARAGIAGSPREGQARPRWQFKAGRRGHPPPQIQVLRLWSNGSASYWVSAAWCGAWGICMNYSQGLSSGYVQWLGSAYGPALRLTALACLAFGAALVCRGLARPDLSSVSGSQEVLPAADRNRGRDAKVPPARRTILDFAWKGKGRN